jgi:hypothetical protein
MFKKTLPLIVLVSLFVSACGGGGGGGDTVITTPVDVFDGAAIGCSVSLDGATATEVGDGAYIFATALDEGTVVAATGCTDSDTQSLLPALSGVVQSGAVVISPITTLIVEAAIANDVAAMGVKSISASALQAAIASVVANLELGDYQPTDPATANYVAAAKADATGTSTAAVAMRMSLAISTLLKSVEVSAGPVNASAALAAVSQAIVDSSSAIDLTQTSGVAGVISDAQILAPTVTTGIQSASAAIATLVTLIINTTGDITAAIDATTTIAAFLNTATEAMITDPDTITALVTSVTPSCTLGTSTLGGCKL